MPTKAFALLGTFRATAAASVQGLANVPGLILSIQSDAFLLTAA